MTHNNDTPTTARALREAYLSSLDDALAELPHGLAVELRAGIAEELAALEGEALHRRIAELGPPAAVARAARLEGLSTPPLDAFGAQAAPPNQRAISPLSESRAYAITAVIIFGVGGIVLPIIGWVIGCALVATSKFWRASEKIWAIAFPFLVFAVGLVVAWVSFWLATPDLRGGSADPESSYGPQLSDFPSNPLFPAGYDVLWSTMMLIFFVAIPLAALWLVLRLRGRRSPADIS